ncbi:glycerophosphodiester phosphodiesterase family protein [Neisseria weixii]|uniref:glycerophosphodiester phosphodiesterase family protein n=1 Tax=Neisseria weixii TaxID=1853276 RepID=UPI002103FE61|nr:glycerophosphodiester phosphodiesterase family protein [Neisseria weixii]
MGGRQGADYLEQDLVMTKDNHLVVIHDHFLDGLTDVAKKFPKRARSDGKYYVMDFTLAEIRSLKMTENFKSEAGRYLCIPSGFLYGRAHSASIPLKKNCSLSKD